MADSASWISGLGNGITGLIGTTMMLENEKQARAEAQRNTDKAIKAIESLDPTKYSWERIYSQYDTPEEYQTLNLSPTAYNDIAVDPTTLEAQNNALQQLMNLSENEGLNSIDRQALQEIINSENANLKGNLDAITQNAMERGIYGSGLELANKLQQAQSSANRNSSQDMSVLAQAQQRALDALSNYGNLSSNMRSQDFSEKEKIANANDIINRANWENAQNVSNANVSDRNKTNAANVDIKNAQQDANFEETNTRYGKDENKAAMLNNQYNTNNSMVNSMADRTNKTIGTLASSLGSAFDSVGNSFNSDKKKKEE